MNRISEDTSHNVQPIESDELAATIGGVLPGGCTPFPIPIPLPFPDSDPLGDANAF